MVTLNQAIKEFAINGRDIDTEGTRASGIMEEIIERFVIERKCSMNSIKMASDRPI